MKLPYIRIGISSFYGVWFVSILCSLNTLIAQPFTILNHQEAHASDPEKIAKVWMQNCAYDLARNYKHSIQIHPELPETQIFLAWLRSHAKTFQQEGNGVTVYPDASIINPFFQLLPDIWIDVDKNEIPDISKATDADMLWEPHAGALKCAGIMLEKSGTLIQSDSIQLPSADSVVFSMEYQLHPGTVLRIELNTSATSYQMDLCADSALPQQYEITLPLQDQKGAAFVSFSLGATSETRARIQVNHVNFKLPQSEKFHLACTDTLKTQPFQMLSYRPEIFLADNALRPGVTILEAPVWMNSDEKAYVFGRATCAPGMYPMTLQFSDSAGHSTTCRMILHVLLPPAKAPDVPVVHQPLPTEIVSATGNAKSNSVSKKGKKTTKKSAVASAASVPTPLGNQASFIQEAVPAQHIRYQLIKDGYVSLYVLNASGDAVRTILQYQKYMPGRYSILWDGSNDAGEVLTGGEYECRMEFLPADGTPPHSESCRLLKVF